MTTLTDILTLPVGETAGTVTFPINCQELPRVRAEVRNVLRARIDPDIRAQITEVNLSGFTYTLNVAPDNANYRLYWSTFRNPAVPAPEVGTQYITEQEVRDYLNDHDTRSGMSGLTDYDFSPSEIASAMTSAAREYNGIPPLVGSVLPGNLTKTTNMFFDAIAFFLYTRLLQQEQRHDTPYKAGSVDVDIAARRIGHYTKSVEFFYSRFRDTATSRKKLLNFTLAMGPVG